jgi:hypothetical protein
MPDRDPFDALEDFFGPYREAFHSGDMAAMNALFEFPYVLSNADGLREVKDSSVHKSQRDKLKGKEWIGTRFDRFRKFRMGKSGAMVLVDYSRLNPDGSVWTSGSAGYLLRHGEGGWKLVGILDEFGSGT